VALSVAALGASGVATTVPRAAGASDRRAPLSALSEQDANADDAYDAAVIAYLRERYDLTDAQAKEQIAHSDWAESFLDTDVPKMAGWAGAWIDHADGGTVYFGAADDATATALRNADLPAWVVTKRFSYSVSDLTEAHNKALDALAERPGLEAASAEPFAVDFEVTTSVPDNRVHVRTVPGSEADLRARALTNDTRFAFEDMDETEAHPASCPSDECVPYRGGIQITGSGICTAGFSFRKNNLSYASTAGHCGNEDYWVHPYGHILGDTIYSYMVDAPGVDYQMIDIHDRNYWKAANTVWRPSDSTFDITVQISTPNSSLVGVTLCHEGQGVIDYLSDDGETCGELTAWDASPGGWVHMGKADFRICGGDSGGPIFTPSSHRAYGLTRGYTGGGTHCSAATDSSSFFTWVSNIEASSGFDLMLPS
jgi:hypothetical protein